MAPGTVSGVTRTQTCTGTLTPDWHAMGPGPIGSGTRAMKRGTTSGTTGWTTRGETTPAIVGITTTGTAAQDTIHVREEATHPASTMAVTRTAAAGTMTANETITAGGAIRAAEWTWDTAATGRTEEAPREDGRGGGTGSDTDLVTGAT